MGKQISSLSVILGATVGPFVSSMKSAEGATGSFIGSVASMGLKLTSLVGIASLAASALSAFGGLGSAISLASELEQNSVAFETMTGSATTAKSIMDDLSAFAASTPFQFPELATSAKQLLAFGVSSDQIVPTLKMLGDVASGVGAPVGELAAAYGKVRTAGRLTGETLMQFNNKGIPLLSTLSKQLGVSTADVTKMIETGKIGFPQVQKAIASLTGPGGQFAGMMEKQSHTLGGLWSTLTDNVSLSMAKMVTTIVDAFHLKDALAALIGFTGTAGDFMTDMVGKIAPVVMGAGAAAYGVISSIFTRIYGFIAPVVQGIVSFIAASWGGIVGVASTVFTAVWGAISTAFGAIYSFVSDIVLAVWTVVANNWESIVDTTVGYWTAIYGLIESVVTGVWTVVSGVASGVASLWTDAMGLIGVSTTSASSTATDAFGMLLSAWRGVMDFLTGTVTLVTFLFSNMGTIIAGALVGGAYEIVKFGNEVAYVFTDLIPAGLIWFGQNWFNLLTDYGNFLGTVLTNMLKNASSFGAALWGAIKGEGFNFEFTGLTEGFKSSLTELPKIADRQIGELEKSLGDQSATLGKALGDGLASTFNQQTDRAKEASSGIKDTIKGLGKSVDSAMKDATKPPVIKPKIEGPVVKPTELKLETGAAQKGLADTKAKADDLAVVFSGSADSLQLRAQDAFNAMAPVTSGTAADASTATAAAPAPQPAPAPVPTQVTADMRESSALKESFAKLIDLMVKGNTNTTTIANNTAKPQVATATL